MAIYPNSGGRFSYTRTGQFRCRTKAELPLVMIFLALIPIGDYFLLKIPELTGAEEVSQIYEFVQDACTLWCGLCVFLVSAAMLGVTYKYYAGEDEFKITDNRRRTEYFYYSDIVSVEYIPITLITNYIRGYQVTITTKYRSVTYDYITFGIRRIDSVKETPFHLLEERAKAVQSGTEEADILNRIREDREGVL